MFCFRAVALLLLFGVTLGSYAPYYDLANAEQHFADFINKYGKKYESPEAFNRHFDIFKKKLNKLNEWNALHKHENGGYVITQFSDQDGTRSCADVNKMPNATMTVQVNKKNIVNAPDKIDYREQGLVTEVKNQGDCGSCYIFSAIGNIESVNAKQTGQLLSLSEQQVLDCATNNQGCKGGVPVTVMNDMVSLGCMAEADYPYTAVKGTCNSDQSKVKVKVSGGNRIDTPDVETMKGALIQYGVPISVVFYATPQMEHYVGTDVLNPTDCDGPDGGNHAILLVGYNADPSSGKRPHWIIKNSWGTADHGDSGYFYLDFESHCKFGDYGAATAAL